MTRATLRAERRSGRKAAQALVLAELEREVADRLRIVRIHDDPTHTLARDGNDAYRLEFLRLWRVALRAVKAATR